MTLMPNITHTTLLVQLCMIGGETCFVFPHVTKATCLGSSVGWYLCPSAHTSRSASGTAIPSMCKSAALFYDMAQHPELVVQTLAAVVWHKSFNHQAIFSRSYLLEASHLLGPQNCTSCLGGCYHCLHLLVSNLTVSTTVHGSESSCKKS